MESSTKMHGETILRDAAELLEAVPTNDRFGPMAWTLARLIMSITDAASEDDHDARVRLAAALDWNRRD